MRRIITGHNSEGKSKIFIDSGPARSIGEDVGGLFEIWNTNSNIIDSTDTTDERIVRLFYLHHQMELNLGIFKSIHYLSLIHI